jgi:hypothetical protein
MITDDELKIIRKETFVIDLRIKIEFHVYNTKTKERAVRISASKQRLEHVVSRIRGKDVNMHVF